MIYIKKAQITKNNGMMYVSFLIENGYTNKNQDLKYVFECKYEEYFTFDRMDGVLVSCLHWLAVNNYDVNLELPVSKRLYYQITKHLLPAWKSNIKINCETTASAYKPGEYVAAGMSCGIDSLATYHAHTQISDLYKINLLTFFGAGAISGGDLESYEKQLKTSKDFAAEAGLPHFTVNSNLDAIFKEQHISSHTFRNCGIVLLFQKMFQVYYYSSTYTLNEFLIDLHCKDCAFYDVFTLPLISTDSVAFYSSGAALNRFEKTSVITENALAKKHLSVCVASHNGHKNNCGRCLKCVRTLTTLDALGKLDEFSQVFDIQKYRKERAKLIGFYILLGGFRKDHFTRDIRLVLKKKKMIPVSSYFWALLRLLAHPLRKFWIH